MLYNAEFAAFSITDLILSKRGMFEFNQITQFTQYLLQVKIYRNL